jgi:hypothetical protein
MESRAARALPNPSNQEHVLAVVRRAIQVGKDVQPHGHLTSVKVELTAQKLLQAPHHRIQALTVLLPHIDNGRTTGFIL